jgi:hypothetical protein
MPLITVPIPESSYILVRDRIAAILADELPNQATLLSLPYVDAKVFTERHKAIDKTETSVVNVSLANGDYNLLTAISQDGTYTFHIDIQTKAKTNQNQRGDFLSSAKVQRLAGICHYILSDPKYRVLGFTPPFIEHTEVSGVQYSSPIKIDEAPNVLMARLTFIVRVPENNLPDAGTLITGYDTTVKMSLTDFGYMYSKPALI